MATVTITISRDEVLADMKVRSHLEAASIGDAKQRYLAELGSEKEEDAHQCITDAAAEALGQLRPFMIDGTGDDDTADDTYGEEDMAFAIIVPPRKVPGLGEALAKALHTYIVDSALVKYYISVSHPELAERHQARLNVSLATIENVLRRRSAPLYPTT